MALSTTTTTKTKAGVIGTRTGTGTGPKTKTRPFSTSPISRVKNQIYDSVRRPSDFHTYTRLSQTSRIPLLTLWTTSYCPTCRIVEPLVRELIQAGTGEDEGGVAFVTVEFDAPDIMNNSDEIGGLGARFMITSIPTLLSFNDAGDPVVGTKVADARFLKDGTWLTEWIKREARESGGAGGGGGGLGGGKGKGILGGLFGGWRS
ncbi:hypothetical protein GGS20DRAFT_577616 [Poronia punctata]|nr:hypothetical protein GGS20DRAFT_577616 [Poronia punctata]